MPENPDEAVSIQGMKAGIAVLAAASGEDPADVLRDLSADRPLARLIRNLLGLNHKEEKRRGRPSKNVGAFDSFIVDQFREVCSLEEAFEHAAEFLNSIGRTGRAGKRITAGGVRSSYLRFKRRDRENSHS